MKLNKQELILYEAPIWAEFISIHFLQDLISIYIVRKINKKYRKYLERKDLISNLA
jgi:hypothetical protein